MSRWIDLYVVEDESGEYYEAYGDEVTASEYVAMMNDTLRKNSPKLVVRHTTVDIED